MKKATVIFVIFVICILCTNIPDRFLDNGTRFFRSLINNIH